MHKNRGEIMTLDEIIVHEKELAKEIYIEAMLCHANPDDGKLDDCIERGKYHEQLAEWLEELKSYREHIFSGEMTQKMLREEYNKAIDTFVTKIKKYMETTEQATYIDEINNGNDNYSAMTIYNYVDELANELKAGVENEQR